MAPIGTLWGDIVQRQTKVICSVAALNDLEITFPEFNWEDKPQAFVTKFTYGKVPAFEHAEGWDLIEGVPIARYLAEIGQKVKLLGANAKESAIVEQWIHFAEHEIGAPTAGVIQTVYGVFNRETLDKYTASLARALTYLDGHLATRSYVALDTLTLADLVLAGVILHSRRIALGNAEVAKYPHVFSHLTKVTEDARVKRFWDAGKWPLVDVAVTEPKTRPA